MLSRPGKPPWKPRDFGLANMQAAVSVYEFPIYAALGVPEIWRYDGTIALFYGLRADGYHPIPESRFFSGLTPAGLTDALDDSKRLGHTVALAALRRRMPDRQ